ncbi:MAG: hypothetical protein H7Y09_08080, partial [Chitinophagaceae bacterium]|nr:hypothetical protein [Anaerolineae bacterium]
MSPILSVITLVIIIAHIVVLIFARTRGQDGRGGLTWLLATIGFSLLACSVYLLKEDTLIADRIGRGLIAVIALIATLTTFGLLLISDMTSDEAARMRLNRVWLSICGLWLIGVIGAALLGNPTQLGQPEWIINLFSTPDAAELIALPGLCIAGLTLISIGFSRFYIAVLPE